MGFWIDNDGCAFILVGRLNVLEQADGLLELLANREAGHGDDEFAQKGMPQLAWAARV